MIKKSITVLGAGGHGLKCLFNLFQNSQNNYFVYYSTVDWGGAQGLWGRLLELNNFELDRVLHNQSNTFLPFGDVNKLIVDLIEKRYPGNGDLLNFRSNNQSTLIKKLNQLCIFFNLSKNFRESINNYFHSIFEYYNKNNKKLSYKKSFCLGYPFHHFIYINYGGMAGWNKFWNDLGILPINMYLDFTADHRQILRACDISLNWVVGEDSIDHHNSPFLPASYQLSPINCQDNKPYNGEDVSYFVSPCCSLAVQKSSFLSNLDLSDVIVLPAGSVANWICLVNNPKVFEKIKSKKIIWIANPYRTKIELPYKDYLFYLRNDKMLNITALGLISYNPKNCINRLQTDQKGHYLPELVAKEIQGLIAI